jgi:hypothetical protein
VRPSRSRADVATTFGTRAVERSGFRIIVRVPPAVTKTRLEDQVKRVRLYAVTRSGNATEIVYGAGIGWPRTNPSFSSSLVLGDREARISWDPEQGQVDISIPNQVFLLTVPRTPVYRWLEVEGFTPLKRGRFELVDRLDARSRRRRAIAFNALGDGRTALRTQVGACGQWYGYRGRSLYLTTDAPQDIARVRVYG